MSRDESVRLALVEWFRREARDLPFRKTRDPYCIWLSEIILQQTRVDQGLPYYLRYVEAFPTVRDLAAASEDRVLKFWEGLGYYTRARNLHKAAKMVVEQYGGELPRNADLLKLLPGIGPYTAGAIASIAFGERVPLVDGNVTRVLTRLYNLDGDIGDAEVMKAIWALAERLVPAKGPGEWNQALMELGARICVPVKPGCGECPVAEWCMARAAGVAEERPVRQAKKAPPLREMVAAAIPREGCWLIVQRPSEGLLGGLWEFPSSAVAPGETHQDALRRIGKEMLGVALVPGGMLASVKHAYSHFKISLSVYKCGMKAGKVRLASHAGFAWVEPGRFREYAFHKACHKFLPLLASEEDGGL